MTYQFNRHGIPFGYDFTLVFDVKTPKGDFNLITEDDYQFEIETYIFTNQYAKKCFEEIKRKTRYEWLKGWTFEGRSNGWFSLLCNGKDERKIKESQIYKIENIIEKYYDNYVVELCNFYRR